MAKTERELREQMLKDLRERQAKAAQKEPKEPKREDVEVKKVPGTLANPQGEAAVDKTARPETAADRRRKIRYLLIGLGVLGLVLSLQIAIGMLVSDDPWSRVPLQGVVTPAKPGGKPLRGSISFSPQGSDSAPYASTNLVDGRFEFNRENGPAPGKYRVLIRLDLGDDSSGKPSYEDVDLEATVPDSRPYSLDLKLPEKPTPPATTNPPKTPTR